MKKIIPIIFIISLFSQTAFAVLYAPPDEWYIEGPGGAYGVWSCHSHWSVVMLGPIDFTTSFGFETTRLIYFEIIPILFFSLLVGVFIFFRARKTVKNPFRSPKTRLIYYILIAVVIFAIGTCIQLPKYFAWRERITNEKLYHAIVKNDFDLVKKYVSDKNINYMLIVKGEPLDTWYPPPLLLASRKGNMKLVKYFLEHGADLERKTDYGSALHQACFSSESNLDIVKYLIKQGADINAVDFWGRTPLDVAISEEIKKHLVQHGGKTEKEMEIEKDSNKENALDSLQSPSDL